MDTWSVGCIFGELVKGAPMFQASEGASVDVPPLLLVKNRNDGEGVYPGGRRRFR